MSDTEGGERSLVWGWVGAVAVLAGTVAVLIGAIVRTQKTPDCEAYSAAGWMFCPWTRAFVTNAVAIGGTLVVAIILCGLFVGVVRLLAHGPNG